MLWALGGCWKSCAVPLAVCSGVRAQVRLLVFPDFPLVSIAMFINIFSLFFSVSFYTTSHVSQVDVDRQQLGGGEFLLLWVEAALSIVFVFLVTLFSCFSSSWGYFVTTNVHICTCNWWAEAQWGEDETVAETSRVWYEYADRWRRCVVDSSH